MQTLRDKYFDAYRSLKLARDGQGVLVAQRHADPQPRRALAIEAVREFFQGLLSVSPGAGG